MEIIFSEELLFFIRILKPMIAFCTPAYAGGQTAQCLSLDRRTLPVLRSTARTAVHSGMFVMAFLCHLNAILITNRYLVPNIALSFFSLLCIISFRVGVGYPLRRRGRTVGAMH